MGKMKFLAVLLFAITLQSFFKDEGDPLPTSGENSFTAKLNWKQFVAEDVSPAWHNFYGITASEHDKIWLLKFSNSSDLSLYFYLPEVKEAGYYNVGEADDNLSFFDTKDFQPSVLIDNGSGDVIYHTNSPGLNETIEITKIEGDSIIIGEFDKITLSDPDNPDKKVILTDGKFNINLATLNEQDI